MPTGTMSCAVAGADMGCVSGVLVVAAFVAMPGAMLRSAAGAISRALSGAASGAWLRGDSLIGPNTSGTPTGPAPGAMVGIIDSGTAPDGAAPYVPAGPALGSMFAVSP